MRGTREPPDGVPHCLRIIPAHAGNTRLVLSDLQRKKDHPRACGEHVAIYQLLKCFTGSSPRMRGTLDRDALDRDLRGIIPAHAGNTQFFH